MGQSQALSAMGITLRRNGIEIAEVVNIDGPEFKADTIEVTHMKSPGFWREFIGSLKDGGDLKFDVNLLLANASHNAATGVLSALAGQKAPPRDTWDIIFPDENATTFSFPGVLTGYKVGAKFDDKLSASITVKVAGQPTLT